MYTHSSKPCVRHYSITYPLFGFGKITIPTWDFLRMRGANFYFLTIYMLFIILLFFHFVRHMSFLDGINLSGSSLFLAITGLA